MPQLSVRGRRASRLEMIAVGHVTVDRIEGKTRTGGAAAYAALTAARLGLESGALTSVSADFPFWSDLENVEVHSRESEWTTEFENLYRGGERHQHVLALASTLSEADLASVRERAAPNAAVLYCPVVHELDLPFTKLAPEGLVGVAPQGLFRRWDASGRVRRRAWDGAAAALAGVDVVCVSERDLSLPEELAEDFAGIAFAVTRGASGCRVYSRGDAYDFPAAPAREVDPTGAGDVFAAALLVALREGRPLPVAVRFASAAGALSVEGPGLEALPTRRAVEARLQAESASA